MCKKFDVIIANPPYAIGNELTKAVVENVEFDTYINLMPVSKYKKNALFSYVDSIEKAEDSFEDATVGDCLSLAIMKNNPCGKYNSWRDFTLVTYNENLIDFYKVNRKRTSSFKIGAYCSRPDKELDKYNPDTDFFIYQRVCADGIDMSGDTYNWNNGIPTDINRLIRHYEDRGYMVYGQFITFNTKEEKDNFANFWYRNGRNGLMHKFIKGLNKHGGDCNDAIPNVDWTRSWTDEELLADYGYTEEKIKEILG